VNLKMEENGMKRLYLLFGLLGFAAILFLVGCASEPSESSGTQTGDTPAVETGDTPTSPTSIAKGGAIYDKWWKAAEGATEPSGDHPLWATQSTNKRDGSGTWRCKECHGWDYQGEAGAYAKGSHFTGFPGVLTAGTTLSADELTEIMSGGNNANHDLSSELGATAMVDLVNFLREGLIDNTLYINYDTKAVKGANLANGKKLYDGTCAACHGTNGQAIIIEDTHSVSSLANGNPWEILHKIRFGQPGTMMPSSIASGWSTQDAVDVLGYAQTLPVEIITQSKADVMAAIDIIDATGFHGISEAIGEATKFEEVSSRTKGSVEKALTAAAAITWPAELADVQKSFSFDVESLIAALDAADLEGAKVTSDAIHGSQHDLSHDSYEWLGSRVGTASGNDAILAALDIIDSSGFHGISEAIEEATKFEDISSRTKGTVEKALTAANAVTWPKELAEVQALFVADAEALIAALDGADLAGAKEASHGIHGTQHDLSHEAYEWLGANGGGASGNGAILAALDIIDSSGFHGISEAIEEAAKFEDISSRTKGTVEKALTAANAITWPHDLEEALEAFVADAEALIAALDGADLAGAKEASHGIHGTQHDLSHEAYELLGE